MSPKQKQRTHSVGRGHIGHFVTWQGVISVAPNLYGQHLIVNLLALLGFSEE